MRNEAREGATERMINGGRASSDPYSGLQINYLAYGTSGYQHVLLTFLSIVRIIASESQNQVKDRELTS